MRTLLIAIGVLSTLAARIAPAQAQSARAFTQFGVGAGTSAGGQYGDRFEYTFEAMFARRLPPVRETGRALLAGLAVGGAMSPASGDVCVLLSDGKCAPTMRRYTVVTALGGVEARGASGGIDVMAGPAVFLFAPPLRVGGMVRVDLAATLTSHVGLVVSPQLLVLPKVANATLTLRSLNVGLRVW